MSKPIADEKNNTEQSKKKKDLRRFKYGSAAVVITVLVIVIVVIFNLIAAYLVKRTPMKLDLTGDKRYELSDETINYLKNDLSQDVEMIVTCSKEDFESISSEMEFMYLYYYGLQLDIPYDMLPIILEKYEMYANQGKGSITVRYVDLEKDPQAVAKYTEIYGSEIEERSIIVSSGDRVRVIDQTGMGSMITADSSNQTSISMVFAGESTITSEIMNVTDANPIRVAFASKLNSTDIYNTSYADAASGLRDKLLSKNGYFCTDVDIALDDISTADYDMIVIPMPSRDFDEKIIEKLSSFLYNDGMYDRDVVFISDPLTTNLPNIYEFLADWSIELQSGYVLSDSEKYMGNDPFTIQAKPVSSDETGTIEEDNSRAFAAPYVQEVKILDRNNENITNPVLSTYDTAFSYEFATNKADTNDTAERNIGVISKREIQTDTNIESLAYADSNLLVLGSGRMTEAQLLDYTNLYSNANVLLTILNNMTKKETNTVIIPEKALQSAVIAPSANQNKVIKIFVIVVIPAVVAVIGLVVLLRRRNR